MTKILLVDDNESNLTAIESLLARDDYLFVKARSGRQALKILLHEYDFAMILMDVKMPNLDGFETAALIYEREKLKHIPIIFITAHGYEEENIYKGYQAGAVDYIYKPINPDLIRAKVSVFIDLYKKNYKLIEQERKLSLINKNLEAEINERKNSEEKVNALNFQLLENIDKLETANRNLDRFAFMASHDLQEPLRKIRVLGSRLSEKYSDLLDEDAKVYLSRIEKAANRMQLLIRDILTFSKISLEEKKFIKSDLNSILNEILTDELDHSIKEKQAIIEVDELPELIVNPNLIRPLFFNIIGNALKYSKSNVQPIIRIYSDSSSKEAGNNYSRIFFKDNGIGFEQKYSEQIFKMFNRLHFQNEYEGTGVGLALCKKIMEVHGGFITATSILGVGSTFIISFPMNLKVTESEYLSVSKQTC